MIEEEREAGEDFPRGWTDEGGEGGRRGGEGRRMKYVRKRVALRILDSLEESGGRKFSAGGCGRRSENN